MGIHKNPPALAVGSVNGCGNVGERMRTDILQQAQAIRASMDAAALEPWQAGTSYAKGAAFVHNGAVYFARQAVVSAEH